MTDRRLVPSDSSPVRRGRGAPLWVHLAAVAAVPLLAIAVVVGDTARTASVHVDAASAVVDQVWEATVRAEVSAALAQELVPLLGQVLLRDPSARLAAGGPDADAAVVLAEAAVSAADTTDRALAAASAVPGYRAEAQAAQERIDALRAGVTGGTTSIVDLAAAVTAAVTSQSLGPLADRLGGMHEDVSAPTVLALRDADTVAATAVVLSQQLPLFLGETWRSSAVGGDTAAWTVNRQQTVDALDRMSGLADADLRAGWEQLSTDPATAELRELLVTDDPGAPSAVDVTALIAQSLSRNSSLAELVSAAGQRALLLAAVDRATAERARLAAVSGGAAAVVVAGIVAWWIARRIRRSLAQVAASAAMISGGRLVEVPVSGPREARTTARALDDASRGLQRIQTQLAAMARGDLDDDSLHSAQPGALGVLVHASVQQMLVAARTDAQLRRDLTHEATHDALTGLANRVQALNLLASGLSRDAGSGTRTGLLFIDLDGFKAVNDQHGHAAGDEVLQVVANRLTGCVRSGDVVCRLGGDEFVVVLDALADETALIATGERIVAAVAEEIPLRTTPEAVDVRIGASVGAAMSADTDDGDAAKLLARADAGAYQAKHHGRGQLVTIC